MGIRKLIDANNEILRKKAARVDKITRPLQKLADDMVETMYKNCGIGLAAPQVGISKQIIVVRLEDESCMKLFNPRIQDASGEELDVEGCLSLPGIYGEVPRYKEVLVRAENEDGKKIGINAKGLLARILQHEIDHLNGALFTDRSIRILDPEEIEQEQEKGHNQDHNKMIGSVKQN